MVTLADLREVVNAEPFVPFAIVMEDGERFFVGQSLDIAIGSERIFAVLCNRRKVHLTLQLGNIAHLDTDPLETRRAS